MASDEYMEDYGDLHLYQCRRMSRLSVESTDGDDADGEISDENPRAKNLTPLVDDDDSDKDAAASGTMSVPGTPVLRRSGRPVRAKEYSSDTETKTRRRTKGRRWRDQCLDRAWEVKKSREAADDAGECRVLVRPRGRESPLRMDMDEVKACRDLGLGLPCDWTVEIPGGFSAGETSSGGDSPVANWMISSPGDDPKDVKARLKAWAQAVALASASRFSG